jgi:cephalosporin hydroxylase
MDKTRQFELEREENIKKLANNIDAKESALNFIKSSAKNKYTYNFSWMGRPIIQYPQDIIAMQELIWEIKPDLIIETGIAHGGSLIFYASMLELIGNGEVLGIDIDIRKHNKEEIENHSMYKRISMIQGSSISQEVINQVKQKAENKNKILVILDSNHTHEHVLQELKLYSKFISIESYIVVFDTIVEDLPNDFFNDRPWGKGNNPKTAVWEFLNENKNFEIDYSIESKLLITVAPDGFLRRIK